MTTSVTITVLALLSVYGLLCVLSTLVRLFLFRRSKGTLIKIIRPDVEDIEYAVRGAQCQLAACSRADVPIILLVTKEEDPEECEIASRLAVEYPNITLCSERMLPFELARIAVGTNA